MFRSIGEDDVYWLQKKIPFLQWIVLVFFLIVAARLFYLQIIRGNSYRLISQQISVREEELHASRGLILDRNGIVLADRRPYVEIVVVPQFIRNREKMIQSLTSLIPLARSEVEEKLFEARTNPPFMPVALVQDAPYDWIAKIREFTRPDYPDSAPVNLEGVEVRSSPLRVYKYPELFSHALGYLKEANRADLDRLKKEHPERYSLGDLLGASGLEKTYDLDLRGFDGVNSRVVDARGREIRANPDLELLERATSFAPIEGMNLATTLDLNSQKAAAEALGKKRGAVVALDPFTGEVIVLYSSPGYDANRIMKKIDKPYWQTINLHEDKYLFNRAIQGTYPPGSTYKIVGAYGGLSSGKLDRATSFYCGGGLKFGNRFFHCWRSGGHGPKEVVSALTQSCDTFFYNVGLKLGVDILGEYARKMGLGEKTGIDLPYEEGGLIPSVAWKMKRFKQPWIESETMSIAIGQGYDLVSPLQNARMIAMIANGGRIFSPRLLKSIVDQSGHVIREGATELGPPIATKETLEAIQEGLIGVVHGPGTARALAASPFKIAGKTGTAQVIGYESKAVRGERTKDHALFVAYAPYDDPKIAISVVVENGGHGGGAAAPIARAVIEAYLGGKQTKNQN